MKYYIKIIFKFGSKMFLIATTLAVCFTGILFFSTYKNLTIANHSFFIIGSSSMEPNYPLHSLVIVKHEPFDSLKIGDVIVFKSDALNGRLAFHRIVDATEEGFYTKGDNNNYSDNQLITEENYVSKGINKFDSVGKFILLSRTPQGFFIFFLLPLVAIFTLKLSYKKLVLEGKRQ